MYVCNCRHDQAAPCQSGYTALAWLHISMKRNMSTMPEEQSLLAAASYSGIIIMAFTRHAVHPVLSWTDAFLDAEQLLGAFNMLLNPPTSSENL